MKRQHLRTSIALAGSAEAVVAQAPDAPGYAPSDMPFPFGFGLSC